MFLRLNHRVRMKIEEDLRSFDPVCDVLCRSSERSFQRKFCGRRYFFYTVAIVDSVRSSRSGRSLQEIRLVKNTGIISKTVRGLVVSVVCTAVNSEEVQGC